MRGGGEVLHPLALEGDADQQRSTDPCASMAKERERAIVVTASHAEAHASPIDADERHEHRVESSWIDARPRACGLPDAVRTPGKRPSCADEDHEMAVPIVDARQEVAAIGERESTQCRREIGLSGQRDVRRDVAQSGGQPRGELAGNREGMTTTRRGVERRACRAKVTPEGRATHRERGGKRRHPPVPVPAVALDQSNKWGELRQVRLSARSGLAQFCQQAICPMGVKIRVER